MVGVIAVANTKRIRAGHVTRKSGLVQPGPDSRCGESEPSKVASFMKQNGS